MELELRDQMDCPRIEIKKEQEKHDNFNISGPEKDGHFNISGQEKDDNFNFSGLDMEIFYRLEEKQDRRIVKEEKEMKEKAKERRRIASKLRNQKNKKISDFKERKRIEKRKKKKRQVIWQGVLEWQEKTCDTQKLTRRIPCQVSANITNGEIEVKGEQWPQKLLMQLIPNFKLLSNFGGTHFRNARSVVFHPQQECEALEALKSNLYAGCVFFKEMVNPNASESKVLMLLYRPKLKEYIGIIPNNQKEFLCHLFNLIEQQNSKQQQPGPGEAGTEYYYQLILLPNGAEE